MKSNDPHQVSDRNRPSRIRTDLAEDRTLLSKERIVSGWIRRGMILIGVALGLNAISSAGAYALPAKLLAEGFLAAAIFVFLAAARKSKVAAERLPTHEVQSQSHVIAVTSLLIFATVMTGAIIWLV